MQPQRSTSGFFIVFLLYFAYQYRKVPVKSVG